MFAYVLVVAGVREFMLLFILAVGKALLTVLTKPFKLLRMCAYFMFRLCRLLGESLLAVLTLKRQLANVVNFQQMHLQSGSITQKSLTQCTYQSILSGGKEFAMFQVYGLGLGQALPILMLFV